MSKKQSEKIQNPQQILDNMLADKLLNTTFKCSQEARAHISFIQKQLYSGAISLDMLCPNKTTFDHLVDLNYEEELSLLDASYFLNCAPKLVPMNIGYNIVQYKDFLEANNRAVIEWNEIVMPIKTSCMREVEAKFSRNIIMPEKKIVLVKN